jgi:hypothetical protein
MVFLMRFSLDPVAQAGAASAGNFAYHAPRAAR